MSTFKVGDKVKAVRRDFAIDIGDTATVVKIDGIKHNPFAGVNEERVTVHVDTLNGNMTTAAATWALVASVEHGYTRGDIIQITDENHAWFPALLIVDEVKTWGVTAYCIIPKSNDGSEPTAKAFNRLTFDKFEKVGSAFITVAE